MTERKSHQHLFDSFAQSSQPNIKKKTFNIRQKKHGQQKFYNPKIR